MGITGILGVFTVSMLGSLSTTPATPSFESMHVAAIRSVDCSVAAAPAKVDAMAVVLPEIVRQGSVAGQGLLGETQLEVDLERNGRPSDVRLLTSSGNRILDLAAVDGASLGAYSAEVKDCQRVAGAYLLYVDFTV